LLLAALALPALAQPGVGVPSLIEGDAADVAHLGGAWVGAYELADTGEVGTLRIDVDAEGAWAVVTLLPPSDGAVPTAVRLAVHHLQVEGGQLRGSLARFQDPAWDIEIETTVGGTLGPGDRLEGHFLSDGTTVDTIRRGGRWWAVRAADRPTL